MIYLYSKRKKYEYLHILTWLFHYLAYNVIYIHIMIYSYSKRKYEYLHILILLFHWLAYDVRWLFYKLTSNLLNTCSCIHDQPYFCISIIITEEIKVITGGSGLLTRRSRLKFNYNNLINHYIYPETRNIQLR